MVRSGNPRFRHWTYSRTMPFKIGNQNLFCIFLSLTLLGRWLRRLCGSLSGGELSPGGEWGWRGSSRWEIVEETRKIKYILLLLSLLSLLSFLTILRKGRWENVKKTWKNEIYLVVVVIVDYCWKFYGGAAAGGRLLRKLGKIRYIWDFVVLDYFCCNFRKLSFRRTFFVNVRFEPLFTIFRFNI